MVPVRFISVLMLSFFCAVSALATPVAMSEITSDLSSVNVVIEGGYSEVQPYASASYSGITSEFGDYDEFDISGVQTAAVTFPGISASSEVSGGFMQNQLSASLAGVEGASDAMSVNYAYREFYVTDATSVTFTMSHDISVDLLTESAGEYSVAAVSEVITLFAGPDQILPLDYNSFDLYQEVVDGEEFHLDATASPFTLSYAFDEAFTGRLVIESSSYASIGTYASPESVPEPPVWSFLFMGLGLLGFVRKRR